jgi:4-amino-4-deoxychorismate lyase
MQNQHALTTSPRLSLHAQVFDRLYNAIHAKALAHFGAFYSSQLGGIVTNPAFMLVHMDDAMVHRAHAVFDTVAITDGYLYMLDAHLARFKRSAEAAGVELAMTDEELKRVLLDTAAASKKMNGGHAAHGMDAWPE